MEERSLKKPEMYIVSEVGIAATYPSPTCGTYEVPISVLQRLSFTLQWSWMSAQTPTFIWSVNNKRKRMGRKKNKGSCVKRLFDDLLSNERVKINLNFIIFGYFEIDCLIS